MCFINKDSIFMDKKTNIDMNSQYSIGLVFGCHIHSVMIKRVEDAYNLYKKGIIKKIYLTGGVGLFSKIRNNTESSIMKDYLINKGVPIEDIVVEDKSTTTKENIKNIIKIINNKFKNTSIVIITSDFHVRRVLTIMNKVNNNHNIYYYGVSDEYDRDNYKKSHKGRRMITREIILLGRNKKSTF